VAEIDEDPAAALDAGARQATLGELVEAHPAIEPLLLLGEPGLFRWDARYQAFMSAEDAEHLDG
jgi:hypothetical protein